MGCLGSIAVLDIRLDSHTLLVRGVGEMVGKKAGEAARTICAQGLDQEATTLTERQQVRRC